MQHGTDTLITGLLRSAINVSVSMVAWFHDVRATLTFVMKYMIVEKLFAYFAGTTVMVFNIAGSRSVSLAFMIAAALSGSAFTSPIPCS